MSKMETQILCGATMENIKRDLKRSNENRRDVCWFCKKTELNAVPHPNWKVFGYVVCKKCLNIYEKKVEKIDKRGLLGLVIGYPGLLEPLIFQEACGGLDWYSEKPMIQVMGLKTDGKSVTNTIIHEWIHWILFCNEGWLTSVMFDNTCDYVFSYFTNESEVLL